MSGLRSSAGFVAAALFAVGVPAGAARQPAPRPFPQPNAPGTQAPAPRTPAQPAPQQAAPAQPPAAPAVPTEATLGLPIYVGAQFIASYDAGRGQRYYLFGSEAGFAELVAYYKTALKQKGELVFDSPPTHMFEVGKFREEAMAFPPGVTIKDYAWGGSEGYPNAKPGSTPKRFRSVIQIVPLPSTLSVPPDW
jgi:hypothetical protein